VKRIVALLSVLGLIAAATASTASAGRYSSGCQGVYAVAQYHAQGWHAWDNVMSDPGNESACE
jgi:hypothetical protein